MDLDVILQGKARLYRNGLAVFYTGKKKGQDRDKLIEYTKQKRCYRPNRTRIQSSSIGLFACKKSKYLLFFTVTLPNEINEKDAARAWHLFLKNMYTNLNIKNYVWIKEFQENGRLHYHILVDSSYLSIKRLQTMWETSIYHVTGINHITHNSVRLGNNPIVDRVEKITRYLSKYISKDDIVFSSRSYGFTQNLTIYTNIDTSDLLEIMQNEQNLFVICEKPYLFVVKFDINSRDSIKNFQKIFDNST